MNSAKKKTFDNVQCVVFSINESISISFVFLETGVYKCRVQDQINRRNVSWEGHPLLLN